MVLNVEGAPWLTFTAVSPFDAPPDEFKMTLGLTAFSAVAGSGAFVVAGWGSFCVEVRPFCVIGGSGLMG